MRTGLALSIIQVRKHNMAVEVVGQDESKYKKTTCENCGAILRFLQKDIIDRVVYSFGESDTYNYIVCPQCTREVGVK